MNDIVRTYLMILHGKKRKIAKNNLLHHEQVNVTFFQNNIKYSWPILQRDIEHLPSLLAQWGVSLRARH